jgi:CheY-like chemotaxis protein
MSLSRVFQQDNHKMVQASGNYDNATSSESRMGGPSGPAIRLDGVRILLVDDSPDNLLLFSRVLKSAGALVTMAGNGSEAVGLQSQSPYDVIIMDIRMPVLDGYQASRAIRAQGYGGPIIALTAHATPGEQERCMASGCSHFRLKPIDRLTLLQAVDGALHS